MPSPFIILLAVRERSSGRNSSRPRRFASSYLCDACRMVIEVPKPYKSVETCYLFRLKLFTVKFPAWKKRQTTMEL